MSVCVRPWQGRVRWGLERRVARARAHARDLRVYVYVNAQRRWIGVRVPRACISFDVFA